MDKKCVHISPAFSAPIWAANGRSIVVWHDVAYSLYPKSYTFLERVYFYINFLIIKRGSHRVVTPSFYVKTRLVGQGIDAKRITVISPFAEASCQNVYENSLELQKPYFLHVSNNHPRKNLTNTVLGFLQSNVADTHFLYVVGSFGQLPHFDSNRIIVLSNLSDDELSTLYCGADALLLFSLDEGFGYPVVEAALHGTVSITSNVGALAEFGFGAKPAISASEIAAEIQSVMERKNTLEAELHLITRKYSAHQFDSNWKEILNCT